MADLHNYITLFVSALGNTIAKRLPRGGGYKYHSHAAGLGERLHHGDPSVFLSYGRVGAEILYVGVLHIYLVVHRVVFLSYTGMVAPSISRFSLLKFYLFALVSTCILPFLVE